MSLEKPQKITDLVENIDFYIQKTREEDKEKVMDLIKFLQEYIDKEIINLSQDSIENKKLITQLTDTLYRKAMAFEIIDLYTNGYFATVLENLFWDLGQKGTRIFYVLDNSMRDDRFHSLLQQFPPAGFAVITPHIADKLGYNTTTTQTDSLSFEDVKSKIEEALGRKKNIIYVERDTSVSYLSEVVELAKSAGDEYAKIFRNKGVGDLNIVEIDKIEKVIIHN